LEPGRYQTAVRHLPADPHQRHDPEFDLLPLAPSIDTDIVEGNGRSMPLHVETQPDSLIHDPAVPCRGTKRIGDILRRSHNVVDKADLTQIKAPGEPEAQDVVLQFLGGQFQNFDLSRHPEPDCRVAEVVQRQSRLGQ